MLLWRLCCALYIVYSYWLVTCELQIEVWSCYYYKCLTVLLQCPVFTAPLLASIHCKNGELYQMGNLIIYSNIIYSPPFSGQLPGGVLGILHTLYHIFVLPELAVAGVYVYCAVCHPNNFNNSKTPTKLLANFQVLDAKNENVYFPTVFPPSLLTWQSR